MASGPPSQDRLRALCGGDNLRLGGFFGADNRGCQRLKLGSGIGASARRRLLSVLTASNVLVGHPLLASKRGMAINFGRRRCRGA